MYKIAVRPDWFLERAGESPLPLPEVLALCAAVHRHGSLTRAARVAGLSYRHAWGLMREAARQFGHPLIRMERGRGGTLTALGETLLWADRRITARLSPVLDSISSEIGAEIERFLNHRAVIRLQASHGFAVQTLREALVERGTPFELKYTGSQDALAALTRGECDVAGFHVPVGPLEAPALGHYLPWLQVPGIALVNLASRCQGLMIAPGNPLAIGGLADLSPSGARFINRQTGSATRMLLDLLLGESALASGAIQGYENGEYTHAAVAAYIASGMADAGFGIETAARQFNLDFIPLITERYFFAYPSNRAQEPPFRELLDMLGSPGLQQRISALPGYDGAACGVAMTIPQAFASLAP